ncbi:GlsB/YeaQ/YmgE family stress response membrane protein [Candidatus Protochlamydia phocaeensis]|uniref:GlsB/YeaQ/YmgE family stress response membrane protein n=1 Tax=Candidatus Protochlamydia phocaeensis TaxID=1414722 RepID=UPI000A95E065|nr:GlsB/YeaQ/YmgE family stress response membrane protein [Candidatus Protochlamydia phocaeensis]
MMSILGAIIIGFIVGLFARFLMPGRDPLGFIWTTLLGIGGAIIGKLIGQAIGLYKEHQSAGFFMSLIGAMILLYIYHHFKNKQDTAP